jgi:hypothetical protein
MNVECFSQGHKFSKMLFDETGPYKICIREGCTERLNYAPKTLAELDVMTMNEIEEMMGEEPILENILKMTIEPLNNDVCNNCKSNGSLIKVEPEKMLDGKILYECTSCGERCYK